MTTDRPILARRLESLREEDLRTLYRRVIRVTTGAEPAEGVEIDRTLHILETTDSERGRLLGRLLGIEPTTSEPWRVSPAHLRLRQTLSFRSVPGQNETRYFSEYGDAIPSEYAERCLSNTSEDNPELLVITKDFPSLPEGWTVVCRPPVSPNSVTPQDSLLRWILVCRNSAAAKSILDQLASTSTTSRPMLVVFDEHEAVPPEHVNDIRSCHIEDASSLLAQFFARSELLINPGKRQLVRAIVSLYTAASTLITRHETKAQIHASLRLALDRAEVEWDEMFRDEHRQSVRDLQLSVVAHPLQKTRLILSSEREAQVSLYLKNQLAPRIENFVRRQAIELAQVCIDHTDSRAGVGSASHHSDWSHLRAGVLMALPNLALLTPSMAVNPSRLSQAIDGPAPLDTPVSPESTDSVGEFFDFSYGWLSSIATKVAPLFEKGKDWLGGILREQFAGIEQRLGSIDARLGQLLGIVIAGQVAAAVAALIGNVIMIKGSISLTQTEVLIHKLLDDLKAEWPRIRQSLEALVQELEGGSSQLLIERARRLVTELNSI